MIIVFTSIVTNNLNKDGEVFSAKILIMIHEKLTQKLFQEKLFIIYERFNKSLMMKAILPSHKKIECC